MARATAAPRSSISRRRTSSTGSRSMTGGRGPDACIDAVGLEAHGASFDAYVDKVKTAAFLATDRPNALRQAIHACRKGGIVSIPGVYGGFLDKVPFGAAFQKGLTFRMGQTHVMQVPEAAARPDRTRRDRSVVRHHPPVPLDDAAGGVQDVPRQAGRLHQGRAEATRRDGALNCGSGLGTRPPRSSFRTRAPSPGDLVRISLFSAAARSVSFVRRDGAQSDWLCHPLWDALPASSAGRGQQAIRGIHCQRDAFRHQRAGEDRQLGRACR